MTRQASLTTQDAKSAFREQDEPVAAEVREGRVWVTLEDGRVIGTPLDWYPMLADGTPEQLAHVDLLYDLVCWPDLDECLSVQAMLEGRRPVPITRGQWQKIQTEVQKRHAIGGKEDAAR